MTRDARRGNLWLALHNSGIVKRPLPSRRPAFGLLTSRDEAQNGARKGDVVACFLERGCAAVPKGGMWDGSCKIGVGAE
jgi:hypothetical protein